MCVLPLTLGAFDSYNSLAPSLGHKLAVSLGYLLAVSLGHQLTVLLAVSAGLTRLWLVHSQ